MNYLDLENNAKDHGKMSVEHNFFSPCFLDTKLRPYVRKTFCRRRWLKGGLALNWWAEKGGQIISAGDGEVQQAWRTLMDKF